MLILAQPRCAAPAVFAAAAAAVATANAARGGPRFLKGNVAMAAAATAAAATATAEAPGAIAAQRG